MNERFDPRFEERGELGGAAGDPGAVLADTCFATSFSVTTGICTVDLAVCVVVYTIHTVCFYSDPFGTNTCVPTGLSITVRIGAVLVAISVVVYGIDA